MKKNYLFGMALMASLAFFSCTNEVIYVHDGESSEQVSDEQIITLQVSNGGDGLTTRAGRPLYSSEAKQTIDYVRLWIFDASGNLEYSTTFDEWDDNDSKVYGDSNEHGREAKITLSGDNKLATGTQYTVYAIGYHSDGAYNSSIPATSGVQKAAVENLQLSYSVATNDCAEEIFAGSLTFTPNKDAFNQTIVLNRQVAGAFVYVEEIPFFSASHQYLKLIASAKSPKIVLGHFANKEYTSNGANTSTNVVNGTETTAGDVVISCIDLKTWFGETLSNKDGLIDATSWRNPLRKSGTTPTFKKGSVFGGTFLIPFAKQSTQTLKLVLSTSNAATSEEGDEVWNINLPTGDNQLQSSFALTTPSVAGASVNWSTAAAASETANVYSILRNHLYGVGKRTIDNPGESGGGEPDPDPDPENPDPGIDDPESLNNKQELTLRVNDNWEVIHGMELE
ncbi:hypothetical protein [Bacteroides ilei]|uniref:hypothetical protein n=1 Tax=Bacteroides ilei TaxID=1907658 RepID=UPI0013A65F25|nr:hypothetical protein [Bacteroides ilei]